jgi:glycosyltransferase involved in cell wall biosynthesis
MKILFDLASLQPNSAGKYHGGGKYGEMIFYRMIKRNIKFSCFYNSLKWLNPQIQSTCETAGIELFDISKMPLPEIVSKHNFNTLFSALPDLDICNLEGCRVVGTLHGLRSIETPIDFSVFKYNHKRNFKQWLLYILIILFPSWWKKKCIKHENMKFESNIDFVVVSDHTKYSIQSYFPDYNKDIKVFYSPNTSISAPVEKSKNPQKYFLMVSGNRSEKNVFRAIEAFDRLVSAGRLKNVKSVVTGCYPQDFRYQIKNPDSFEFVGYVSDEELQRLYADAYLFVYPSLNEGFGYPPLEAMRYSVPVMASPYSAISDILGGGALYFNPQSVEEIMSRMLMMMEDQRHELYSKLGHEQYVRVKERQDSDLDKLIDYILI